MGNEVEEKGNEEDLPMMNFFSTPKRLPLNRYVDHHILSMEGQKLIKIVQIWVQSKARD